MIYKKLAVRPNQRQPSCQVARKTPNGSGDAATTLRRVGDDAVAAVMLGAVERVVGALEDVADRFALELKRREPDRDRDLDLVGGLVDREGLAGDRTPQPLRYHAGDMQIGFRHHDD